MRGCCFEDKLEDVVSHLRRKLILHLKRHGKSVIRRRRVVDADFVQLNIAVLAESMLILEGSPCASRAIGC